MSRISAGAIIVPKMVFAAPYQPITFAGANLERITTSMYGWKLLRALKLTKAAPPTRTSRAAWGE